MNAGKKLPRINDFFKKEIDIPWRDIAGMRDIIAHDYFGMDLKVVWDTAKQSVPEAEVAIDKYLKSIGE